MFKDSFTFTSILNYPDDDIHLQIIAYYLSTLFISVKLRFM